LLATNPPALRTGSGLRSRGAAAGDGIDNSGPRRLCRGTARFLSDTSSEECHWRGKASRPSPSWRLLGTSWPWAGTTHELESGLGPRSARSATTEPGVWAAQSQEEKGNRKSGLFPCWGQDPTKPVDSITAWLAAGPSWTGSRCGSSPPASHSHGGRQV